MITTQQAAAKYLAERAIQCLKHGVTLASLERLGNEAVLARFQLDWNERHETWFLGSPEEKERLQRTGQLASIYLLDPHQGQGRYKKLVQDIGLPILTHEDCGLAPYLCAKDIPHIQMRELWEYTCIARVYGARTASRSGVPLMRHIDEGLAVLHFLHQETPSPTPQMLSRRLEEGRAFCLHPLLQQDIDLVKNWDTVCTSARVAILAMEYRNVANRALSSRPLNVASDIELSPLPQVNNMLVADKVQNRKDFELYHKATHPRSENLDRYFRLWLERLWVFEEIYQTWAARLYHPFRLLEQFGSS